MIQFLATTTQNEVDYPNLGFSFAFLIEIFIFVLFSLQFIFRRFSCWQLFSFDQNLLFQILWRWQIVPEKKVTLHTSLFKLGISKQLTCRNPQDLCTKSHQVYFSYGQPKRLVVRYCNDFQWTKSKDSLQNKMHKEVWRLASHL